MKRFLAVVALVGLAACGGNTDSPTDSSATLVIQDLVVGTGATAVAGDTITVNYVGTFTNGTKFDASADHGGPFQFRVGVGGVIAGWDQGIPGMKVGGKRHLVIPPSLAYGNNPPQGIPSNATLVFDVDLLSIVGK